MLEAGLAALVMRSTTDDSWRWLLGLSAAPGMLVGLLLNPAYCVHTNLVGAPVCSYESRAPADSRWRLPGPPHRRVHTPRHWATFKDVHMPRR